MADGSISGNSGKAVEESEEMAWLHFSPSPTYFPSPAPDFPPSPPLEFPRLPPPPSSDSRPVLPLAFDGSQPPMENPHQFTSNSLPLLPPPPQNQQQVISPTPQHQDNVFPQYLFARETVSPRGRMVMNNSRGEQSISIPQEGIYVGVRQRSISERVADVRLQILQSTFYTAEEAASTYDQAFFELRGENARLSFLELVLGQNRAAESTAPPRTELPPPPAQQRNPGTILDLGGAKPWLRRRTMKLRDLDGVREQGKVEEGRS